MESRIPYGQEGKGPGLGPAWKREESKSRPEPLLFPVLYMSSPTEIKRILGLSSQKPESLPGGSGLGLFPLTGKSGHNYLGRAQLPGRGGFIPFLFPVELGCLDGAAAATQQQEVALHKQTPPGPSPLGGAFTPALRFPLPRSLAILRAPSPYLPPGCSSGRPPSPWPRKIAGAQGLRSSHSGPGGLTAKLGEPAGPGSRSFLEDILALCLQRGAALPGNMAVTAGA